jgi:hypothetical protein
MDVLKIVEEIEGTVSSTPPQTEWWGHLVAANVNQRLGYFAKSLAEGVENPDAPGAQTPEKILVRLMAESLTRGVIEELEGMEPEAVAMLKAQVEAEMGEANGG